MMDNKYKPKTRDEFEQEFKELIRISSLASNTLGFNTISIIMTNGDLKELKELFYNVLKRVER